MNLAQKFLKRKIRKYKLYCRDHYMRDKAFPSTQLCTNCKYGYTNKNGEHVCQLMHVMKELNNKVPADWNSRTIDTLFADIS